MLCTHCKHTETQVIDSRDTGDGVRRRRECLACKSRFTTYERSEAPTVLVEKKSGEPERFATDKLRRGIALACKNRPVSPAQIDSLVEDVEQRVFQLGRERVSSREIGSFVQAALQSVDPVAYIRFASVYQEFSRPQEFEEAVHTIN
jgi:transcriptional repressor NrdR